jgi:two-component system, LytTR family, response regulator
MKIRSMIIDDEPFGVKALEKLLEFHCPEVKVTGTCNDPGKVIESIKELKPQLVFMDVSMPQKNAFELLDEFDEIDFEIIFVTAYSSYMMHAFKFSAVDYLLKPVDDEMLVDAVKRATERIESKTGQYHLKALLHNLQLPKQGKPKLCIPSIKGFQVVELDDILYCEASNNYTNFNLKDGHMICASRPIHEYEELLQDSSFFRLHKSYLVNLDYIKEYIRGEGGRVKLVNGAEIEISRRKKDELMRRMKEHYKY